MSGKFLMIEIPLAPLTQPPFLPSPMMPIRERVQIHEHLLLLSAEGLKTIILITRKLKTITLPKDWPRLTVLQAESYILQLILQIKT